ncbi:MAG: ABC transporter ATP-binding protein [Gemmatimonadota bacterium]
METDGGRAARCAIRTERLTRDFSTLRAVDRLDLEVASGTVFGLLGPNGAGKTTTIRLLLGLLHPTAGRARVLGHDTRTQAARIRQRTGVLLEHSGLIERLSAEENLEFYGRVARMPSATRRARIRELLDRFGLWERRRERVGTWSRGTRQKLAVARALLHRPPLVILDEPTAGLDPVAAVALREQLAGLAARERTTVVLTTHNLAEAEKLCDRVGVIRGGRLLTVGRPAEIRARSRLWRYRISGRGLTENVRQLVGERREVAAIAGDGGNLVVELQPGRRMAPLISFLVRVGAQVEEVQRVGNSLEEVFLSLVTGEEEGEAWRPRERSPVPDSPECVPVAANGGSIRGAGRTER